MFVSIVRFILGFAAAVLAAGLVQVLFVAGYDDLIGGGAVSRFESLGLLVLLAATQTAVFATPFALLGAVVAAWRPIRSRLLFGAAGLAIGLAGFYAQHISEQGAEAILNRYALAAYAASGLVGGLVYWLVGVPKRPKASKTAAVEPPQAAPDPPIV